MLAALLKLAATTANPEPVALGTRRELFVDRALVDRLDGAELRQHSPVPAGTVLRCDAPWEGALACYFTVMHDGDRYRMYYRGEPLDAASATPHRPAVTCYAESTDGVTWTKPELGLFEVHGSKANNVILADAAPMTHNFSPFIDTKPGVPADQRYKATGGNQKSGLLAYVSADGIRWTPLREEGLIMGPEFDSQNLAFWSEHEGCYVAYFRTWDAQRVRRISRSTSPDFLEWTEPEEMGYGDAPVEHLYTNQIEPYFRAPHLYIGLAARFMPKRTPFKPEELEPLGLAGEGVYRKLNEACSDAVLMSVRDPHRIDRTFPEAAVRPGLDPQNWGARSNYPALGIVQTGPAEMSVYLHRHYGQPTIHLERFTYRLDGFASVHAGHGGGELVTKPITFAGNRLELNVSTTAAGAVKVELQRPDGTAIDGYALNDCDEILGDSVARTVTWNGNADLSELKGTPVRIRFRLHEADVYSYRFAD